MIHADGTARLQIVREHTDAVTYAYLKALGRRIGVEVAVNTSFNVAGPIAQSPVQAIDTLRRANGMDGVFMFSAEGPTVVAWAKEPRTGAGGRIREMAYGLAARNRCWRRGLSCEMANAVV